MKKVCIIGTGNVGLQLGKALRKANPGRDIVYGTRTPDSDKVKVLLSEVKLTTAEHHKEAVEKSDIIFLCTPGGQDTIDCFTTLYKAALLEPEKIVVDVTNPFALDHPKSTSGGEMLQGIADSVRVVKALNSVGANLFANPVVDGQPVDAFVAGDNARAKKDVSALLVELGFNPVDVGGISSSRWLEALAYGWVHMAHKMGMGRSMAWKLVKNKEESKE